MTKKKAKKRTRASKELTRKQLSRLERERRIEKWLLWGVGALGVLVVAVLIYGYVAEEVVKAREPVAVLDDAPITTAEFQSRVRFLRMQMQLELQRLAFEQSSLNMADPASEFYLEYIQGNIRDLEAQLSPANALVIGEQVLDQLVVGELVEQEAARRGIEVTAEELQQGIELYFGYDRNPATPTPVPTDTPPLTPTDVLTPEPTDVPLPTPTPMTEDAFRQLYDQVLRSWKSAGISEQQYRSWMEASLLLEKLREQMDAEVPTTADQVTLRYMSVDSEEWANDFVSRLDAGEDFEALADELEGEEQVTGYDRELDWYPLSALGQTLGTNLAELAFSLAVGEHSQAVMDESGARYYVIEILGHEERDLGPYALQQAQEEAFQEWVEAQKQISLVEYPAVRTECWGDTPWYQEECRSSWRDRDPAVCRWALFWPCAGSWQDRVPMDQ